MKRIDKTGFGLQEKNLIGIPWRVALGLQDNGWILRQDIIWSKLNPMPESVTDRFTKSHEYIFLLSKSPQYYFDHESAMEVATGYDGRQDTFLKGSPKYAGQDYGQTEQPFASNGHERWTFKNIEVTEDSKYASDSVYGDIYTWSNSIKKKGKFWKQSLLDGIPMRHKRDVWSIPVGNYKGAHFATYPMELVENCLLCGCPVGGTVLDPFSGSGTTGICAVANGRKYIGIELNKKYVELSNQRFDETFYRKVCPKIQSDCTDFKKFDFGDIV
jgi:DNA modification methylase